MNEAKALTIEAGKFYRTRDGKKAFIECLISENPFGEGKIAFRFIGFLEDSFQAAWTSDGNYHPGGKDDRDLIAEWIEPKRIKGVLNVYADDEASLHISRQAADTYAGKVKRRAVLDIDVLEGHGLNGEAA